MSNALPRGWARQELGDVVTLKSGGTPDRATEEFWGGEIPWITAKDLKVLDLHDSLERLTPAGAQQVNTAPPGTVLILVRGMGLFKDVPIGITSVQMTFNQDVKALIPKANINSRYLAYALISMRSVLMGRVDRAGHGTGRLATDFLLELPVTFPPRAEQGRIVKVLGAWDQAVAELECLISAKRKRKAGIIARIMSDSRAKRGFIRDLAEVNPRNQLLSQEAQVSFVAMGDVSQNGTLLSTSSRSRAELGNGYTQFIEGDILVAKITPCFENGKGALAVGLINGIGFGTTEFHVIRPHDPADAEYLHQMTLTRSFRAAGERHMTGSAGQRRVPAAFVEDFPILIMNAPARRNTGELLTIIDTEVRLLDRTLSALRKQKLSLMQKLLSGQRRLDERFDLQEFSPSSALAGSAI